MLVLLLGSMNAYGQTDFDYCAQSNVSGSTIYTRWANWIRTHYNSNGYYSVNNYGGENGWRGWSKGETTGRPTTWYHSSWMNPSSNSWNGEDMQYWYHFLYENISEVTPDHPYVEIWVPTYDQDSQSNNDAMKGGALYVTNAQGNDVLVGVQQYAQRQLDNYYYQTTQNGYAKPNILDQSGLALYYGDSPVVSPGILINWGMVSESANHYGTSPEYVKLRYYPGWNMGESFDMSFIVNWDQNSDNNNSSTEASYNYANPRYVAKGTCWYSSSLQIQGEQDFYWSTDWQNMFVTKGIKINNKVNAPTITRQRNGGLSVSASGVKTYSDFTTTFVIDDVGNLELGKSASGSTTFSGIDHKNPLSYSSKVVRTISMQNGSLPLEGYGATFGSRTYYPNITTRTESTVQEFNKSYTDIPGCVYPTDVEVEFDKWNKKAIITWNSSGTDNRNADGKFFVYRFEEGSSTPTLVGTGVGVNDVLKMEDTELDYNKNYTYKVSFILNSWQASDGPEPSLTEESSELNTTPTYSFTEPTSVLALSTSSP